MEILKIAIDWAKTEVFSSAFFVLFGIMFILATIGFWQLGKSDIARAYIIPTLVAGILLLIIGLGLIFNYQSKITNFPNSYNSNATEFVETELAYAEKTLDQSKRTVFKIIPVIITISAILIIFIDSANWRASLITTIAFLTILLLVDSNAIFRLENYIEVLAVAKGKL